ncbi:PTS sugar transporter subunit IIA [Lacisediminihabitans sp.]|uniref:PTS sugar transporter subunit IIA n=1 Tax=Lacisediminihabitans sp. TaxID=2787631 RepID=UPI002F94A5B5
MTALSVDRAEHIDTDGALNMARKTAPALAALLADGSIRLGQSAVGRVDAIRQVGAALCDAGAVDDSYVEAMLERERSVSTYVGEGVAIPHATFAGSDAVRHDALVIVQFPAGVDWDGHDVRVCVGIAAQGNGHIALLSQLATVLLARDNAATLRAATSHEQVLALLHPKHSK